MVEGKMEGCRCGALVPDEGSVLMRGSFFSKERGGNHEFH